MCQVIHKGGAFTNAFPWAARRSNHSKHKMVLVLEEVGHNYFVSRVT
jgi:hypothetical protein